jgi:hypothetical protein
MWRWSGCAAAALLLMMSCGQTVGSVTGREMGGTGGREGRTGGRSGATTGGEEPCPNGTETCPCYGNDTCNDGLVCASGLCVDLSDVATGGQSPITNAVIVTNTIPTNVLVTNVATTNAIVTNVATSNLPTNLPTTNIVTNLVTNGVTNVATTNVGITNGVTNVTTTNVGVTNGVTNVATNAATTNATPLSASYIDDGTIHGYCVGLQLVSGVETECDLETGLSCPYALPGTSWDDIAMIQCNVNQPIEGGDGSEGTWTPDGVALVCVEGTGFERIQIGGPNGATDVDDRWCAAVPAGGCVALSEFNTTCWDNSGSYYAGEPLQTVAALQPSKSDGVDVAEMPISDTIVVTAIYVE